MKNKKLPGRPPLKQKRVIIGATVKPSTNNYLLEQAYEQDRPIGYIIDQAILALRKQNNDNI